MIKQILILSILLQFLFQALKPCFAQTVESIELNGSTSLPAQIRVPIGNVPFLSTHATGDQIYQCGLIKENYTWTLKAPDAKLLDARGGLVGNHYAGPVWEYKEGSRIEGRVINKVDIDPDSSISWLLVKVIAHKGKGMFSDVSYINRIHTNGGLPPSSGCDMNHLGTEKRVAYTADYVFYK